MPVPEERNPQYRNLRRSPTLSSTHGEKRETTDAEHLRDAPGAPAQSVDERRDQHRPAGAGGRRPPAGVRARRVPGPGRATEGPAVRAGGHDGRPRRPGAPARRGGSRGTRRARVREREVGAVGPPPRSRRRRPAARCSTRSSSWSRSCSPPTSAGSRPSPPGAWTSPRSASHRCRPASSSTRRRPAAGSCAASRSCRSTRRTTPGPTRSTASSAYVDVVNRTSTRSSTSASCPIPAEHGNYDDPEVTGPLRTTQKPIAITQPEGPSFTARRQPPVSGRSGSLRVGFDAREGLVLHQIAFHDGDRDRPIIHRASIAEMVVPYGDPSPVAVLAELLRHRRVPGRPLRQLPRTRLRLPRRHHLPRRRDRRRARQPPRDAATRSASTRRTTGSSGSTPTSGPARPRPAATAAWSISFFTTVGNYDYGFYWYLYLDGTIEFEAKATGVVFTSAYPGGSDNPYASQLAPGLGAPYHQHLFSARLDMTVDGATNRVEEIEVAARPHGTGQPARQRLHPQAARPCARESAAQRLADRPQGPRLAHRQPGLAQPAGRAGRLRAAPRGQPDPAGRPGLLDRTAAPRSPPSTCGSPATTPAERYAAGDFVNQHPGGAGLPAYAARRPRHRRRRTSSSGTRSASPTSRARRTGRSCPSTTRASRSTRSASSTATPPSTSPAPAAPTARTPTPAPAADAATSAARSGADHD